MAQMPRTYRITRYGYVIRFEQSHDNYKVTIRIKRPYDHKDIMDSYTAEYMFANGLIWEELVDRLIWKLEESYPFNTPACVRYEMQQDMANEPLQSRRGSQVWYPGQKEPFYRPKPRQKQPEIKKPPMRLEVLKDKILGPQQFYLIYRHGVRNVEEDGKGPESLSGLRVEDFEQFAIDLKDQMVKLQLNSGSHHSPAWGQQRSPFWFIHEELFMPRVVVIHDAETASYDLKFDIKGSGAWTAVEGVIAIIKATIPVSDRAYDPGTKQWSIGEKYWPALKQLLEHSTFIVEESKKLSQENFYYEAPTPAAPSRDSLGMALIKLLGIDSSLLGDDALLKKAYRKKALELHPDRNNGDGSRMSELNSIWTQYTNN